MDEWINQLFSFQLVHHICNFIKVGGGLLVLLRNQVDKQDIDHMQLG